MNCVVCDLPFFHDITFLLRKRFYRPLTFSTQFFSCLHLEELRQYPFLSFVSTAWPTVVAQGQSETRKRLKTQNQGTIFHQPGLPEFGQTSAVILI